MATHLRTELVLEALNMALTQRRPADVIHHLGLGWRRSYLGLVGNTLVAKERCEKNDETLGL